MKKQKSLLSLEPDDQTAFEEQIQEFKSKRRAKSGLVPGVIFIGHIPHGFYEEEMKKYFKQFGKVLRVRLARSRKTGGSRGYAFVEFECDEVAKIAADTMNNYLMFEKILKCEFIPPEEIQPDLFRGWRLGQPLARTVNRMAQNKTKIRRVERNNLKRRLAKLERVKEKLASIGVNYDLPVELPVHSKLPKMPLKSVEKSVPFKEGSLLKGKRIVDEGVHVNTKSPSSDTDVSLRNRRTEFHLGTSDTSTKSGSIKKRKSSDFKDDFVVQSSNDKMRGNRKRRSLDSMKKSASQPWFPDIQYPSGTPGKFMLTTAEDVALAAQKFVTSGKKNDGSFDVRKNVNEKRKSQDVNVSEQPSFGNKSKSWKKNARQSPEAAGQFAPEKVTPATAESFNTSGKKNDGSFDVRKKINEKRKSQDVNVSEKPSFVSKRKSSKNASQSPEAAGRFAAEKFAHATAESFSTSGKKLKSHNRSLKVDDLSGSKSSPFCPKSNSTELFEDSARMKTKKGKRSDAKTSTPISAERYPDTGTSGDDSSRYTLEIDTSENEITVRTPPKATKKSKSKSKWQKQKKPLSFGKSPSNFSVSEISQKPLKLSQGASSGWKVSVK